MKEGKDAIKAVDIVITEELFGVWLLSDPNFSTTWASFTSQFDFGGIMVYPLYLGDAQDFVSIFKRRRTIENRETFNKKIEGLWEYYSKRIKDYSKEQFYSQIFIHLLEKEKPNRVIMLELSKKLLPTYVYQFIKRVKVDTEIGLRERKEMRKKLEKKIEDLSLKLSSSRGY